MTGKEVCIAIRVEDWQGRVGSFDLFMSAINLCPKRAAILVRQNLESNVHRGLQGLPRKVSNMRWMIWMGVLSLMIGLSQPALGCLSEGMGSSPSTQEPTHGSKVPTARVTLAAQVAATPITGRLYLFTTTDRQKIPMRGVSWSQPEPFFGLEVTAMQPVHQSTSKIRLMDFRLHFPSCRMVATAFKRCWIKTSTIRSRHRARQPS